MKVLKRRKPAAPAENQAPEQSESVQKADKHAMSIAYSIMKRARAKKQAEPK